MAVRHGVRVCTTPNILDGTLFRVALLFFEGIHTEGEGVQVHN